MSTLKSAHGSVRTAIPGGRATAPAPHAPAGPAAARPDGPFTPASLLETDQVPPRAWLLLGTLAATGLVGLLLTSLDVGGLWTLLLYSIPSNTAIAVLPHEPILLVYGARADVWLAATAAAAGTVVAGWIDYSIFVPILNLRRILAYKDSATYITAFRWFSRAPFAAIVVAGLTPIPFFPFKLLAFSSGYSRARYLSALILGRFPRYALILWLGAVVPIPSWALIAAALLAFSAYGVHFVARRFA